MAGKWPAGTRLNSNGGVRRGNDIVQCVGDVGQLACDGDGTLRAELFNQLTKDIFNAPVFFKLGGLSGVGQADMDKALILF